MGDKSPKSKQRSQQQKNAAKPGIRYSMRGYGAALKPSSSQR